MDILDILLDILLKPPQPFIGLFLHVDPGILPLLMMRKGYITAEIDKLAQYPEYTEVIRMDPPEAAAAPPKKRTRQETAKAHHALPSLE